ncbi:MAG: hypothetical protein AB7P03_21385 [Kofleriaceae bacterium]
MKASITIVFFLATACHQRPTTPAPPPTMGPTIGSTHAPEANEVNDEAAVPAADEPAPAPGPARALLSATNALQIESADTDHRYVVRALAALADALEAVVPAAAADVERARRCSEQLERSPERATNHSDLVRDGLDAAVRALAIAQPASPDDDQRVHAAMVQLTRATGAISPDAPLRQQLTTVRDAFRAATLAVYAVAGAREPHIEPPVPVAWL